jgi:hypothetical protein
LPDHEDIVEGSDDRRFELYTLFIEVHCENLPYLIEGQFFNIINCVIVENVLLDIG